jgi:hypothetical protein
MIPQSAAIMFFYYTNVLGFTPSFMGFLRLVYAVTSIVGIISYN